MNKVRICLEINGLGEDEQGNPCPAGAQITLGETELNIDYHELTKDLNIPGILKMMFLDAKFRPDDVRVITPEEYDERYGDEE